MTNSSPTLCSPDGGTSQGKDTAASLLLVDDHADFRRSIHEALAAAGYDVHSFPDGEALLAEEELIAGADLLVVDLQLPGMGGDLLVSLLWERHGPKKVLFLSATATPSLPPADEGESCDFLEKPFRIRALLQRCEQLLQH